jgi:hypothetical protein
MSISYSFCNDLLQGDFDGAGIDGYLPSQATRVFARSALLKRYGI